MRKRIIIGICATLAACFFIWALRFIVPIGILIWESVTAKVAVIDDPQVYGGCIGENADYEFGRINSEIYKVFPASIEDVDAVKDFKYIYYNPFDPQYVSYLTIQYDDEAYEKEVERLSAIGIEEKYIGRYSVTGPPAGYKLLAMKSYSYEGFGYAMIKENADNCITYVGIEFCNYFLDLDIHKYVPDEYLLEGFDATMGNPYEKKMMNKK